MPNYRLHYFPESGNSYKLALMLNLCGQAFEPVWTDFGAGVTWTAEWRRSVNQMGEIPVLEVDGSSLTQTAPILLRLAETYGRFQGRSESEHFEVLRWLFWDNQKLSSFMASYRYMRAFTPSPDSHVLTYMQRRIDDFLSIVEQHLQDRPFYVRLSIVPDARDRLRSRAEPSGGGHVVAAHRRAAGMAGALRSAAGQAAALLRVMIVAVIIDPSSRTAAWRRGDPGPPAPCCGPGLLRRQEAPRNDDFSSSADR
jgi:glutathione S-transferase